MHYLSQLNNKQLCALALTLFTLCAPAPALRAEKLDLVQTSQSCDAHYKVFESYGEEGESKSYAQLCVDFTLTPLTSRNEDEYYYSVELKNSSLKLLLQGAGYFSSKKELAIGSLSPNSKLYLTLSKEQGELRGHWQKDFAYTQTQQRMQWQAERAFSHFNLASDLLISIKDPLENIKNALALVLGHLSDNASERYRIEGESFIATEHKDYSWGTEECAVSVNNKNGLDFSLINIKKEKGYWSTKRTLQESLYSEVTE